MIKCTPNFGKLIVSLQRDIVAQTCKMKTICVMYNWMLVLSLPFIATIKNTYEIAPLKPPSK